MKVFSKNIFFWGEGVEKTADFSYPYLTQTSKWD